MRSLILAVTLLASGQAMAVSGVQVNGNTLSWTNTGGWMQVQSASDYADSPCEGYISSCEVEAGTYHVIDHDNGTRSDFNTVTTSPSAGSGSSAPQIEVVSNVCYMQYLNDDFGCSVSCPAGKTMISVLTCRAEIRRAEQRTLPSGFASGDNTATCFTPRAWEDTVVTVSAGCM